MVLLDYTIVTILVFTRMASMFGLVPIFGATNTPIITKIGLIFFTSLIMVPAQLQGFNIEVNTFLDLGSLIIMEAIIGFSMGLITTIIINAFYLAGSLVDRNMGFAMVFVIGAQDESQLPVSANVFYIFSMMIFIILNVHHALIKALYLSYTTMPIGSNPVMRLIVFNFTDVLTYTFDMGFRLAAPFILTVLIANILLGLLSKAMPGMNVFMIGMPLKILVGLMLFSLVITVYGPTVESIFEQMMNYIYQLIGV